MRSLAIFFAGTLMLCGTLLAVDPPDGDFPILGGSLGQTIRIAITADGRAGCAAVVGFRNSLNAPPEPDRTLSLAAGNTGFVDLNLSRLAPRFGQRVELRPFVQVTSGQCDGSVEVFEVFTGHTTASLRLFTGLSDSPKPGTPGLVPPPDPDFPALGAVRGQLVRLGVARTQGPPEPDTPGLVDPPEPECQAVLGLQTATATRSGRRSGSPSRPASSTSWISTRRRCRVRRAASPFALC
ncbi:MAG: hypothetical protein LAP38_09990 [Acidobacteriia bacterium]|nr:hypothetical protein [Terriglobia bacterium]